MTGVVEVGLRVHLDGLSVVFVRPSCKVADVCCHRWDVKGARDGEGFAIIERFDASQLVVVLLDEVRQLHQNLATLRCGSLLTPDLLESLASGLDSDVNVLRRGLGDLSDFLRGACTCQ